MEGLDPRAVDESSRSEYNPQGWPRGISLQLTRNLQISRSDSTPARDTRTDTGGMQLDTYIETPNFGVLSLHALALGAIGGRGTQGLTSWSIRQSALPFDGGWFADNTFGTTNLTIPESTRRNTRLTLPTPQILGASSVWRRESVNSIVIGASAGEPGRFEGFPQSRFVGLGGRVESAFAQYKEGEWTSAVVLAQGTNVLPDSVPNTADNAARTNPRGVFVSVAQEQRATGTLWQLSALGSRIANDHAPGAANASGVWADAIWRDGAHRQQASIFRFNKGLTWIDRALANDLQGASYRYDYHSIGRDFSANIESFSSVTGENPSGWYASTGTRQRLDAAWTLGGGLAIRSFGLTSSSGYGFLQWLNKFGVSRVQIDVADEQQGQRTEAMTLDHSIHVENGMSLSTSLGVERLRPAATLLAPNPARSHAALIGVNGRVLVMNDISLQGNVRARNVRGNGSDRGTTIAASVSVDWQIARDWSLGASFYENRGVLNETIGVQSPLTPPEIVRTHPNDRGVFVTLRYAASAGTASAPLGGYVGGGSGRIEGVLYLDANGNGIRDGGENGAANVVVMLDGKFTTRTNAQGVFEFPAVVAGTHSITVLPDDLPLPWSLEPDQKFTAPVTTRGSTRIDIGAKRMP